MTKYPPRGRPWKRFLLTCLLRGMTGTRRRNGENNRFLLTCLLRGMTSEKSYKVYALQFLLTCLLRGMTQSDTVCVKFSSFLLTCLLRGMTISNCGMDSRKMVSTHMPLARHDCTNKIVRETGHGFYSHASCEA